MSETSNSLSSVLTKKKLSERLGSGLFGGEDNEVAIQLDQPSVGRIALSGIENAWDGFDWEDGIFILTPKEPLVSWSYLEQIHPGIRDLIESERKAYSRRPRRVIVAGSRSFGDTPDDRELVRKHLEHLVCPPYVDKDKIEIISGCARGADTAGAEIAKELGYAVKEFPADWDTYGKAAGMIRNKQMADYASEDDHQWKAILIAFWDGESRGTENMIDIANKAGIEVKIIKVD